MSESLSIPLKSAFKTSLNKVFPQKPDDDLRSTLDENNQNLHNISYLTDHFFIVLNIYIIIIIMSSHECRFFRLSLAIRLYRPSHSAGPLDNILCLYRAVLDKF